MKLDRCAGFLALGAVVLFVFNFGAPHDEAFAYFRGLERGTLTFDAKTIWTGLRSSLTDDGDVRRYYAYARAALGRSYCSYYVRTDAAWAEEFARGAPGALPDDWPTVTPPRPLTPYRDFLVEYPPPFFLWAIPLAAISPTDDVFRVLFGVLMGIAFLLSVVLLRDVARAVDERAKIDRLPWLAAAAALCLGLVVTHRFDAWIALLLSWMTWALVRRRPAMAGGALGAAVAVKLIPILSAPLIGIYLARERRYRELVLGAGVALGVVVAMTVPAITIAGSHLFDMLRYHQLRPLQVESTWAALLSLWRLAEPGSLHPVWSYGSSNVDGAHATGMLALVSPVTVLAVLSAYALAARQLWRTASPPERLRALIEHLTLVFGLSIALAKVFSPQYLVWLLPFALLQCQWRPARWSVALFAILGLTQIIFPGAYKSVETLALWASSLVLLRNLSLIAWVIGGALPEQRSELPEPAAADALAS